MSTKDRRSKEKTLESISYKIQVSNGEAIERREDGLPKGEKKMATKKGRTPVNLWSAAEEEALIKALVSVKNDTSILWDAFASRDDVKKACRHGKRDARTEQQLRSKLNSIKARAKAANVELRIPHKKPVLEQNFDDKAFLGFLN